jgi:hypothetical protein
MESREFRKQAEECERLARGCLEAFVREALIELATDLRIRARVLEQQESAA